MRLALNINTFSGSDDLEGCLRLTADFGIRQVELWANNCGVIGDSPSKFAFTGKDLDAAERLLREYGISVCCLTFGGGLDRGFAAQRGVFAKEFVHAVEVAGRFGASVMNHYADEFFEGNALDMSALDGMWGPAVRRAEELGIVLALENEAHDFTQSPVTMKRVIDHFASACFKTNFDPTNYYHSSHEPFPGAYEVLKDDIAYFHIKNGCVYNPAFCPDPEWRGGAMSGLHAAERIYYLDAASGAVNIEAILRRMAADGYDGFCALEPHTTRQKAIDCIRREVGFLCGTGMVAL